MWSTAKGMGSPWARVLGSARAKVLGAPVVGEACAGRRQGSRAVVMTEGLVDGFVPTGLGKAARGCDQECGRGFGRGFRANLIGQGWPRLLVRRWPRVLAEGFVPTGFRQGLAEGFAEGLAEGFGPLFSPELQLNPAESD